MNSQGIMIWQAKVLFIMIVLYTGFGLVQLSYSSLHRKSLFRGEVEKGMSEEKSRRIERLTRCG